jgi:hypothetical protein
MLGVVVAAGSLGKFFIPLATQALLAREAWQNRRAVLNAAGPGRKNNDDLISSRSGLADLSPRDRFGAALS